MTTVLITGSRDWHCHSVANSIVFRLKVRYGDDLLIRHGAADGVDSAFEKAAQNAGIKTDPDPADWKDLNVPGVVIRQRVGGTLYSANAGPIRNSRMVAKGADFALAFSKNLAASKGTSDCVKKCFAAGIPVYLVDGEDAEPRLITEI